MLCYPLYVLTLLRYSWYVSIIATEREGGGGNTAGKQMSFFEDEIKKRYSVLVEQAEKLKGSIRILRAQNEQLHSMLKKETEKSKMYKDAFENIFINNIGNAWEVYPDEEKEKMSVEDKISLFNKEVNISKLYIREQALNMVNEIKKSEDEKDKEIVSLNAQIENLRKKLANVSGERYNLPQSSSEENSDEPKTADNSEKKPKEGSGEKKDKGNDVKNSLKILFSDDLLARPKPKAAVPKSALKANEGGANEDNPEKVKPHQESEETDKGTKQEKKAEEDTDAKTESPTREVDFWGKYHTDEKYKKWADENFKAIDKFINNTNPDIGSVIMAIGSTGEYTIKGISSVAPKESNLSDSKVRKVLNLMIEKSLVSEGEVVSTNTTGRKSKTYVLSPFGNMWYAIKAMENPKKSLLVVGASEQKSKEHYSFISNIKDILEKNGFETATEVSLTTSDGRKSIADISASDERYTNLRIECERGNYSKKDYIDKFKRALDVSERLLVAVPSEKVKKEIQEAVEEAIREVYHGIGNMKKAGRSYRVFTETELKNHPKLIYPESQNRYRGRG